VGIINSARAFTRREVLAAGTAGGFLLGFHVPVRGAVKQAGADGHNHAGDAAG
jgi:hypothetical protein